MQKDVDLYRQKVIMGTHTEMAPSADKEGQLYATSASFNRDEKEGLENSIPVTLKQEDLTNQVILHKEMLQDFTSEKRNLRFHQDYIDFNFTESGRLSEGK